MTADDIAATLVQVRTITNLTLRDRCFSPAELAAFRAEVTRLLAGLTTPDFYHTLPEGGYGH